MTNPAPIAALSFGLLARKGEARPAMRAHRLPNLADLADAGAELGWNDMGTSEASPVSFLPESGVTVGPTIVSIRPARRVKPVTGRTAVTLRLDANRHARLRHAAETHGRSGQQLLTEALDAFLETLPEVKAQTRAAASLSEPLIV